MHVKQRSPILQGLQGKTATDEARTERDGDLHAWLGSEISVNDIVENKDC